MRLQWAVFYLALSVPALVLVEQGVLAFKFQHCLSQLDDGRTQAWLERAAAALAAELGAGLPQAALPDRLRWLVLEVELPRRALGTDASFLLLKLAERPFRLTLERRDAPLAAALAAGVLGYQLKEIAGEELVQILRRTAAGEAQIHPRLLGEMLRGPRHGAPPAPSLSQREREVLLLIAEGLSNQAIGERLGIGEATVKTHVGNLLAKLGLADRTQLAVHAWRSGWVSGGRSP